MIQSMTGYGRGTAGKGINKITSFIKVVNGRYLDIKIRGVEIEPSDYNNIRSILVENLVRGTVHVNIEIEKKILVNLFLLIKIDLKLLKKFSLKSKKNMDVI